MPHQHGESLMRIDEAAVAVDGADAVAVAVSAEAGVIFAGENSLTQRVDVGLDGLGVDAAEARVSSAANFVTGNSVAGAKFTQQAVGGAVHYVGDEAEV